jgi:hypothetical protein
MPQHATATRTRRAPVHPRRVSGPSRRPVPVGPPLRGRTGAFERLSRLPDHRVVDRLLRGRACIWVIGIMLGGIVAMQVSLLRLNSGISRAVQTQDTLVRKTAALQGEIAESTSGEKIRVGAADLNMVDPPAGDVRYLKAHPGDADRAARRMKPPSDEARAVMENGGKPLGTVVAPVVTAVATPVATVAAVPTPVATVAAVPTATPVATAAAVATPVATATPLATVTAPQG